MNTPVLKITAGGTSVEVGLTRVLIDDGSRHTKLTGYGNLSRSIMEALTEYTDLEIGVRHRLEEIPKWVRSKPLLDNIPVWDPSTAYDCVLHICSPGRKIREKKPALLYTQHALSMLHPDWIEPTKGADGIIVPGQFDARIFRRHFEDVSVCHQHVDEHIFKPRERFRVEGPKPFSFLFVGSFSYRKGVDVLLKAFPMAFTKGQNINLTLHCFSGLEGDRTNQVIDAARALPPNLSLQVYNGNKTPEWMARTYNQHDAIVSFSRGEGWCMPLHEALLCHKPIVFPDSTAMGECLPDLGSIKVPTEMRSISDVSGPLGKPFRSSYGYPGNMSYDVDPEAAATALRLMYDNYDSHAKQAKMGRNIITRSYSKQSMAEKLQSVIRRLV